MCPIPMLLSCLALASLAATASAAPIRMTIEVTKNPGIPQAEETHSGQPTILDPEARQTYLATEYPSLLYQFPQHPDTARIERDIRVKLSFDREGAGPVLPGSPSIVYDVRMSGETFRGWWDPNRGYAGEWEGVDISTMLLDWSPESGISRPLLDFFTEQASFTGWVFLGNGYDGRPYLPIFLDLPEIPEALLAQPVPEPSALAAWGIVGLAALVIRHRRRRRTSVAKASAA